tara:strand:+ start:280 stop:2763 length:2484 start_codon:yes stop_codon:yes gene_type:complete
MPKQFKTYTRFDGGLNTKTNARSIADNELAEANNVIVDEFGIVKSSGKTDTNSTNYNNPSLSGSVAGYGLFQAIMDYDLDGTTNTPTAFTFIADTNDSSATKIDIAEDNADFSQSSAPTANQITLAHSSASSGGKVVYDLADGAVRVADANFGVNNIPRRYGHIKNKFYFGTNNVQLEVATSIGGGGAARSLSTYDNSASGLYRPFEEGFVSSSGQGAPTNGGIVSSQLGIGGPLAINTVSSTDAVNFSAGGLQADHDAPLDTGGYMLVCVADETEKTIENGNGTDDLVLDSSTSLTAGTVHIAADAGTGFVVEVVEGSGGTFTEDTYEFAQTFIYDGNQESLPTKMNGTITVGASKYLQVNVIATHPYANRVTGGRIYIRPQESGVGSGVSASGIGEWQLLADISLTYGVRTSLDGRYSGWSSPYSVDDSESSQVIIAKGAIKTNNIDTFETINGYTSDVAYNHIGFVGGGYKTSVVSNRRRFIGNVKVMQDNDIFSDSLTATNLIHRPDRLMYSEANKFDTFTPTNFIDIGVNDGEEFVKLEAFADRILAYKNRTLYIINVGGGSDTQWFLESTKSNMGVAFHEAVVKTELGVCWVNKNGLYIYDGSNITNLQTKILESDWEAFVGADTMIGYEPTHKHLVIVRSASDTGTNNGDAYVYSFISNSFTFVKNMFADSVKSNMITDIYNKMTAITGTSAIVSYDGEPKQEDTDADAFDIKLKDDDFGLPNMVKKIYGVTVEYASGADNTDGLKYFYTDDSGTKQAVSDSSASQDLASTSNDLDVNKITFTTPLLASSFQVQLDLDGNSTHKVNSVGVEYRPIYKRVT